MKRVPLYSDKEYRFSNQAGSSSAPSGVGSWLLLKAAYTQVAVGDIWLWCKADSFPAALKSSYCGAQSNSGHKSTYLYGVPQMSQSSSLATKSHQV